MISVDEFWSNSGLGISCRSAAHDHARQSNPVIEESVAMVCAQVRVTILYHAGQS